MNQELAYLFMIYLMIGMFPTSALLWLGLAKSTGYFHKIYFTSKAIGIWFFWPLISYWYWKK